MSSSINDMFVQYFNEALAMENAAEDRILTRIQETSVERARQQLQYHVEETRQQQSRLRELITNMGGSPTTAKADLPAIKPTTVAENISGVEKKGAKSMASKEVEKSRSKQEMLLDAEKELIRTKEDAIIENAEIVSYKMLMEMADKADLKDASAKLQQSLQEEVAMANFISGNAPMLLSLLWPKIQEQEEAPTTSSYAREGGGKQEKIAQA